MKIPQIFTKQVLQRIEISKSHLQQDFSGISLDAFVEIKQSHDKYLMSLLMAKLVVCRV
ncbi:hypothetical protein NIES2135_32330 [Leptolyngbya boryana NIES-2135]|jgi:hypothetical protein|uniref:Uncharacterized protein n=1 Tax=Leptolyngbya boryana NIES-2135 TaxID=1973484 RepID=A0A1Z4JI15_LEPBY|nr:hypothetical protein [Leptolyngbya sp. FACHB-239]BAY56402.1 hypothetical protein NIES2135_32330 [Leptolyngbya boryana NIES-2135]